MKTSESLRQLEPPTLINLVNSRNSKFAIRTTQFLNVSSDSTNINEEDNLILPGGQQESLINLSGIICLPGNVCDGILRQDANKECSLQCIRSSIDKQ